MHPTIKTRVKRGLADVDRDIAPLVNWLNSYPSLETLFSCQGDEMNSIERFCSGKGSYAQPPYVLFKVNGDNYRDLMRVMRAFEKDYRFEDCRYRVTPEMGFDVFDGSPRYTVRFDSHESLMKFYGTTRMEFHQKA